MLRLASSGLRLLLIFVQYMKRRGLLNEGARRQLAKDMGAVIQAGELASEIRGEIAQMTDDEVDEILRQ